MEQALLGHQVHDLVSPGVYFWKRGSRWLYVGASMNPLYRVSRHNVIGRVEFLEADDVIGIIPTEDMAKMEASLIAEHHPKYNPPPPPLGSTNKERQCPACTKMFLQRRPHQVWCSVRCRQGYAPQVDDRADHNAPHP
jgi:predicted GIY-YIG superfamily endonuclease